MNSDWVGNVSMVLNLLLGSGFAATLITLRSKKKEAAAQANKAAAEATGGELLNVEAAIKIWREIAQDMSEKYESVSMEVVKLSNEVRRLNSINNKIMKLLDRITPENLEKTVAEIKKQVHEGD